MQSDTQVLLQVHSITKQIEYKGAVVELTETISHLPAGSQLLFSSATFEKLFGRLHEVKLPADPTNKRCSLQQKASSKKGLPDLEVSSETMATCLLDSGKHRPESSSRETILQ